MEIFEAKVKKWGNSLGFVIPKQVVEQEQLEADHSFEVMIIPKREPLGKQIWGKMKSDKTVDEILEGVDDELYPEK